MAEYVSVIFKRWTFQAILNGMVSVDSFFFLRYGAISWYVIEIVFLETLGKPEID